MIELTDMTGTKFEIMVHQIEVVIERRGNTSEIVTSTGQHYEAKQSPSQIRDLVNENLRWVEGRGG